VLHAPDEAREKLLVEPEPELPADILQVGWVGTVGHHLLDGGMNGEVQERLVASREQQLAAFHYGVVGEPLG
jgi:hypothetical protein